MRACEATGYVAVFATVAATAATVPCAEGGGRGTSDGDTDGVAWAWWELDVGSWPTGRSIAADVEIFSTAMRRIATCEETTTVDGTDIGAGTDIGDTTVQFR